jgi:hypothetical protein
MTWSKYRDNHFVDTLAWLFDTPCNKLTVSTLQYNLNIDLKLSDHFSYEEVLNRVMDFEASGLLTSM